MIAGGYNYCPFKDLEILDAYTHSGVERLETLREVNVPKLVGPKSLPTPNHSFRMGSSLSFRNGNLGDINNFFKFLNRSFLIFTSKNKATDSKSVRTL